VSRRLVAVSEDAHHAELVEALLDEPNDYDVIAVESLAHGYSRIRHLAPDAIIVLLEMDDPAACQLLSMLKADGNTSHIPIITWVRRPSLRRPAAQSHPTRTAIAV
jgi:CheY-like chemotaxis protein